MISIFNFKIFLQKSNLHFLKIKIVSLKTHDKISNKPSHFKEINKTAKESNIFGNFCCKICLFSGKIVS